MERILFTTKSSVSPWLTQLFKPLLPPTSHSTSDRHIPQPSHNNNIVNLALNRQLRPDTPVGCGFRLVWLGCVCRVGGVGLGQPCLSCLRSLAGASIFELLSWDSKASELPRNCWKSSRHWVRAVQSIAFTRNCWKRGQSCSTQEVQKQKQAQGIFKSLTDRSKPKFITNSLFNVVFFFTHLSLKETLLFFFFSLFLSGVFR